VEDELASDTDHLDIFKKIPGLERTLTATVRHQLANYLQEKVRYAMPGGLANILDL
jgi:hypothetical protein